jgi:hypothetical protein
MKKLSTILVIGLLLALSAAFAAEPAPGAPKAKDSAAPNSEKKGRGLPFHGNVAAIDRSAKTITMEGKKQRVFHLTAETKINRDKKPTTIASLSAGDYVGGYAREMADGKLELVTLNIGSTTTKSKSTGQKSTK